MPPSMQLPDAPDSTEFTWHISSRSASTSGNCVEVGWRTSSRSANTGGNCVEVGPVRDETRRVAVRDSKDRTGGMLLCGTSQWTGFLAAVKTGALDLPA